MMRSCLSLFLLLAAGLAPVALLPAGPAAEPAAVTIERADGHLDFKVGKDLSARYVIAPEAAKPYFWPVNAPHGVPVTRSWPMVKDAKDEATDHVHQKSVWFCHGDIIPEGIELKTKNKQAHGVDFWSEAAGHGKIVCTKVGSVEQKGNHGQVTTVNEWRTADGEKILDETRTIHLHNLGDAQLYVFDIDLHASVCPITFGDTKEGSFGVRVRKTLNEAGGMGTLTNAEGKSGEKNGVWGQVSAWCDYSGPVGDRTAGVALLADPRNSIPTCWHSRAYGLMAANPFGRAKSFPAMKDKPDLVKLAKGEHLKLRYGLLVHLGDVKEGKVAENYEKFTKLK